MGFQRNETDASWKDRRRDYDGHEPTLGCPDCGIVEVHVKNLIFVDCLHHPYCRYLLPVCCHHPAQSPIKRKSHFVKDSRPIITACVRFFVHPGLSITITSAVGVTKETCRKHERNPQIIIIQGREEIHFLRRVVGVPCRVDSVDLSHRGGGRSMVTLLVSHSFFFSRRRISFSS